MLSTAMELMEAVESSIFDRRILNMAGELQNHRNELPDEVFAKYLFRYSAALVAKVADSVTRVLLTEAEMSDLNDTITEYEELTETILEEND